MAPPQPPSRPPWSRRERILLCALAALAAVGLGLALGLIRARQEADCWRMAFEDDETRAVDVCGTAPLRPAGR